MSVMHSTHAAAIATRCACLPCAGAGRQGQLQVAASTVEQRAGGRRGSKGNNSAAAASRGRCSVRAAAAARSSIISTSSSCSGHSTHGTLQVGASRHCSRRWGMQPTVGRRQVTCKCSRHSSCIEASGRSEQGGWRQGQRWQTAAAAGGSGRSGRGRQPAQQGAPERQRCWHCVLPHLLPHRQVRAARQRLPIQVSMGRSCTTTCLPFLLTGCIAHLSIWQGRLVHLMAMVKPRPDVYVALQA